MAAKGSSFFVIAVIVLIATWTAAAATNAAELPRTWKLVRAVEAPEAVQAAAADEQHFYAVANAVVARYDRATGRRLAISTGTATHLNSGFLYQGKLYCAHSNYPQLPEHSELKVLDLDSMQLSTAHDFGDRGGSLTWAVWREGNWYCNFARYGDDQRKTTLVKFDGDWKELSRWSYPTEVLSQLGRYSLSGGIWRDGVFGEDGVLGEPELLVTGHDDPVLFRLRLPKRGDVLEFIGQDSVPFTGQGIAIDTHTGGLVGIDRGKRRVVFAAPPGK